MNFDIVFAGVGGQGILSVSTAIAASAMQEGYSVKQSEVHGMSQRGGAVYAALRIADHPIESALIPQGTASLLLSMEPLESLRYLQALASDGKLVTATTPVVNMKNYPVHEELLAKIRSIPNAVLLDVEKMAREAGSVRTSNMVLVGAASRFLPLKPESLERAIKDLFVSKGEAIVEMNRKAFLAGREATTQK